MTKQNNLPISKLHRDLIPNHLIEDKYYYNFINNFYFSADKKTSFCMASILGDLFIVKILVKQNKEASEWVKEAFRLAAINGHLEIIQFFDDTFLRFEKSVSYLEEILMLLVQADNIYMFDYLVNNDAIYNNSKILERLLKKTIEHDKVKIFKYLLNHFLIHNVDIKDNIKKEFLYCAIKTKAYNILKVLYDEDHAQIPQDFFQEIINEKANNSNVFNNGLIVKFLLKKSLMNEIDIENCLFSALKNGKDDVFQVLIDNYYKNRYFFYNDFNYIKNLFKLAIVNNQLKTFKALALSHRHVIQYFKNRFVYWAASSESLDVLMYINNHLKISNQICQRVNLNIKDGATKLYLLSLSSLNTSNAIISDDRKVLRLMQKEIIDADPIYHPSVFWKHFNRVNLIQLKDRSVSNFKRNVNQNYFNYVPLTIKDTFFSSMFKLFIRGKIKNLKFYNLKDPDVIDGNLIRQEKRIFQSNKRWFQKILYRMSVGFLIDYVSKIDKEHLLQKLEEPKFGNPIDFRFKNRLLSQDLANSIQEYYIIMKHSIAPKQRPLMIAELGAGYGRLAYVFLKARPCKYFVFDIPPALYVAQKYISKLFNNTHKIFNFRSFTNFSDVEKELEESDIAFFTSNQIQYFPEDYFDISINVSSLHEMYPKQADHFRHHLGRITRNNIYLKQYKEYKNPLDKIIVREDSHVMNKEWREVYYSTVATNTCFFEKIYLKEKKAMN